MPNQRNAVIEKVKDFIEGHYAERISLSHVAHALHYSPAHLTHVVRKATGRPVNAWIIERRLIAARERLLRTDDSVGAVSEAVGFGNAAYFVRQFARANGLTPTRWRQRYLSKGETVKTCPTCGAVHFFESSTS